MSAQTVIDEENATVAEQRTQELQNLKLAKQVAKYIMELTSEARTLLNAAVPPDRPPLVDEYIGKATNAIQVLKGIKLGQ